MIEKLEMVKEEMDRRILTTYPNVNEIMTKINEIIEVLNRIENGHTQLTKDIRESLTNQKYDK